MINFKKTAKRIGAGIMAGICAVSMLTATAVSMIPVEAAESSTENPAFPSADALIAQAATLLGTKYGFGKKGYSGIYYQGSYKPLTEESIRRQGIDCSGLIYYSMTHLGYSTTGFDWNNPVPVDTDHWLSVKDGCTITYDGVISQIDIEKQNVKTTERPYWECADGSMITPGSVVIAEIPNDINHSWIYMGEFNTRDDVITYLRTIGVPDSLITDKTVGDGSGDGGTHWRIESNGSEGVVVNNKTTGKKTSALNMYAFRITQGDVKFTITKVLSSDNTVKICGTSPIDGTKAVYGVYTDTECTQQVGEIIIGEDGTGSIELPNRQYYVREITAPTGYTLNPEVFELRAGANVNVTEDIQSGSIQINKTAEDGIVGDREFLLTWTENGTEHTKSAKTDENGVANFDGLRVYDMTMKNAITYTVSEVNIEERYVTPKAQDIVLTSGNADLTVTTDFENTLKKGSLRINKQSEDGQNGDRHFTVSGGGQVYEITTGADGIAILTDIPVFDSNNEKIVYTVSENDVPIRYVIPADQPVTLTADATIDVTFENKLKKFTAEVTKSDSEKLTAQGDATLAGAVYGLYKDGELVDTYTTNENGWFRTNEYECGNYTIQEITPSNGYLLDERAYSVGAEPEHYTVESSMIPMNVTEDVIKGNVAILKHSDDNEDEVINLEAGAEFEVFLRSAGSFADADEYESDYLITDENGYAKTKDMPYGLYTVHQTKTVNDAAFVSDFDVYVAEDGKTYEYILNNAPFKSYIHVTKLDAETGRTIAYEGAGFQIYDANGSLVTMGVDTFYTNSEGFLITPDTLPYSNYTLVEVQAPMGYVLDSTPVPFSVSTANAKEENAVNIVRVEKADTAQKGRISVQKTGEIFSHVTETNSYYTPVFEENGLADAAFEVIAAENIVTADSTIRANAGDVVAELVTDENGFAETGLLYLGKYEVREVSAPFGYVRRDAAKTVELTYAGQEIAIRDTVGENFWNDYQGVQIHLSKAMERDELFGIGANNEYLSVRFGLYAAENIAAADGTMIPEDGFITSVVLKEDMTATISEKIPFGKYYVQEIATDEHYVLNGEKFLVVFEYMGQEMTTVDIDCGQFTNALKRGSVEGKKIDHNGKNLSGARFGLFRTGTSEFTEAAALMTDVSDKDGSFGFTEIPYGEYVVREIEAPIGYVMTDEIFPVTIAEDGDVVEITAENSPISVAVSKETIYGEELPGAEMQIIDEDGNVVDEWISDGTNHIVSKIPAGSYTLKEIAAPDGYVIATDIAFTIDIDGNVTVDGVEATASTIDGVPLITMVDATTIVRISKTDITTGEELEGATLQVIDENDTVIEEWGSGSEPHFIEAVLTAGKTYTLRETIAPDGFVLTADITFTVNEDSSVTEVEMVDDTTKVQISKKNITTDEELPGASLQVIDEKGVVVEKWISGTTPHYIEAVLVAGKTYTLHETAAPDGYVIANDVAFTVNADGSVTPVTMVDDTTKVRISKTDITTGEELEGAALQIIDENGEIVEEWISTTEPHYIEGILVAGKTYTLRETIAPDGFVLSADVEFTVNEDGSVTEVEMVDDTTKVQISKQDATTGAELAGATLQVIDENGEVVEEWISTNEPHMIEGKLTSGKTYTLREITAPDGYEIAEDAQFTVAEDGSVTEVVMKDVAAPTPSTPYTPSTPSSPPTGDAGANPLAFVMIVAGVLGLAITIHMSRRKKGN